MFRSSRVGSVAGIGIFVHWTFWLLPLWFGLQSLPKGLPEAVLTVGTLLAFFFCVLLHELGHAFTARGFGIRTLDITMYPIGGAARLERMSERPVEELLIALAGPAVNVVIAFGLVPLLLLMGAPLLPAMEPGHYASFAGEFLARLLVLNVGLVVFNLLPVFPMDGGRVLRAVLSAVLDRLWATRVAVAVALPIALAFIWGAFNGAGPLLAVIAVLVLLLGQAELAVVRYQEARKRAAAEGVFDDEESLEVWPEETVVHPSAIPAERDFSGFTWDREAHLWIEWRHGQAVCAMPDTPRG
jgi:Zn-dependent protease